MKGTSSDRMSSSLASTRFLRRRWLIVWPGWKAICAQFGKWLGLVMLVLTRGVALFKEGLIVGRIRKVMPYLHHVTAAFLILAGSYIVYYWLFTGGLLSPLA